MTNEHDPTNGAGDIGAGRGGGDDEPTVVIVPRPSRPAVSKALRILGTAFRRLWHVCHETAGVVDEATALGLTTLTHTEVEELDHQLEDAERQIQGIRASLRRAANP